ncbi:MAG: RsmD family RNA methyltransferase [Candidatus Dojkabacteria bacterium]|nr:RsmD family RNA methyltransferase [Candidatus Dojkabacteria bacterium]
MSLKIESFKKLRKEKKKWKVDTPVEFEEREEVFLRKRLMSNEPTIDTFVRITGGERKNFRIDIPRNTRPLTDRMKVKIFDILREDIVKKNILDLYAGSGSFGLEALSRGAESVTFVDASKNSNFVIQQNIAHTGYLPQTTVVKEKVEEYLYKKTNKEIEETFDIIFMDPPYKLYNTKKTFKMQNIMNMASKLLPGIVNKDTKKFKGALIVKHPRRYPIDTLKIEKMKKIDTIEIGLNCISIYIVHCKSNN